MYNIDSKYINWLENHSKLRVDRLSGVALILDNSILLVKPLKFKGKELKWSIPKGKLEYDLTSKENAVKEFREETGIDLPISMVKKNKKIEILYYKNNIKIMDVYYVNITADDLLKLDIKISTNGKVELKNSDEIHKCKFFNINDITILAEPFLSDIIFAIENGIHNMVRTSKMLILMRHIKKFEEISHNMVDSDINNYTFKKLIDLIDKKDKFKLKKMKESLNKMTLWESKYSENLYYPFIIKMLTKMYGFDVNMDILKNFENSSYYIPTTNSFDYMEQYNIYMLAKRKGYINEVTDSSSTGSYETPGFLAKNIPNMKQGAKTTYGGPGGKFVKIKAKCRKYPYCNQGAIDNPLELSDKYKGESSLSGEMKLTPTYPKGYKGNIHLPKTKWVNESLEYSGRDITKLPVIGKVITYPIGPYGEGEENVVEIIKGKDNENIYVTDKWYKEHKRIPLIIHSKLVKEYIPLNINEGIKDNFLKGYDKLRDSLYTIYYVAKTLGKFGYNFPALYRDYKKYKHDKDALLLVTAKYKADIEEYMENLFKKHPEYEFKRMLNNLSHQLKKLEGETLDNFEKNPNLFTNHQKDILLKSYDITPDGIKRKNGIDGNDIDKLKEEIIPGGKSSGKTIKEIAKIHKVPVQVAMKELLKGIKIEMEHTNSKKVAREIAKDHLYEDIFYYKKLSKIEK